ncbi:MAG: glycerol-3-phosphate dehydrogenase [Clostridiales bacterium]|nr:glycerol-3-phosphate dehydrogenase [Clostridiales bacterium]
MAVITIVGAGMMGSALAFPARENGHEVRLVGTHLDREIIDACRKTGRHPKFSKDFPNGVRYYQIEEMEQALENAELVIGGVSSFGVEWFSEQVLPRIPDGVKVLTVTKGLMDTPDGQLLPYPYLWKDKLEKLGRRLTLMAIGGPCTSYELVAHDQTEVAFCGWDMEALKEAKSLLQTSYYHISLSSDVMGVESAVALKNGFALGIALTIGVNQKAFGLDSELHFNSQAAVFGQASREMYRLLTLQGVKDLNNLWLGVGDLYVTVYGGRTRLAGILLGRGMDVDGVRRELNGVTLESLVVAVRVARAMRVRAERGEIALEELPLLMHVDEILSRGAPVDIPWERFTYVQK